MRKIIALTMVASFIVASLTGCGSDNSSTNNNTTNNTQNNQSNNQSQNSTVNNASSTAPEVVSVNASDLFTDRDYATDYYDSDYTTIDLSNSSSDSSNVTVEGSTFTITAEGTYRVTGSMTDGQIIIDVSNIEKVQLMLDGASLSNSSTAPIYVKSADKVFITTASGTTNTLEATLVEDASASTNIDGVIFSHDDITLNGEGTLTINSTNGNGIVGKDDLKITSGTYNVTADKHGIEANNSIRIAGGTYNITAEKDGFHCEYADDTSKGYIFVLDGTFNLDVEADGIDASSYVELVAGTYNITTGGGWANAPVKVAAQNQNQGGGMTRRAIATSPIVSGFSIIAPDFISAGMGGMGGQPGNVGQGDQMMGGAREVDEELVLIMLADQPEMLYEMVAMFTDMTATEVVALAQDDLVALVLEMLSQDGGMVIPGGMPQGGMMGDMPQDGMMGEMPQGGMMGEMPQDGMMGEMPQGGMMGEMPQDGMMGEMPQGGMMGGQGDMAQGDRGEMMQGEMGDREQMMGQNQAGATTTTTEDDGVSRKAIKAGTNITIHSGVFDLDSYDDAVHADGNLLIKDGDFTIGTSDDALHADYGLTVEDGKFIMVNCHEGVEGQTIDILGGYMDITCNDDGFNAASSNGGEIYINIEGGEIYINGILECDGFDSNGNLYISGGYIQISGTTETRDTVLDYQNTGYITGGSFIATGSASQTLQNFGTESTQGSIVVTLASFQSGKVTLTDSKGNVIVDITPPKEYQAVTISTPDIVVGETYTLVSGDITTEIEMTSLLYGSGNQSGGRR